jgi:hypothetical protein
LSLSEEVAEIVDRMAQQRRAEVLPHDRVIPIPDQEQVERDAALIDAAFSKDDA